MEYYNTIAKSYNKLHKEEQLKKINIIKKYIKPKGILLDIGAGTGLSTLKSAISISLDPSLEMLKHPKFIKILGRAESLPFPKNSIDTIISVTSLHLANPKKSISEIRRVAKEESQIAISILKKSKKLPIFKKLLKDFKQIEEEKDIIFIKK